jgi:hypothetical protein
MRSRDPLPDSFMAHDLLPGQMRSGVVFVPGLPRTGPYVVPPDSLWSCFHMHTIMQAAIRDVKKKAALKSNLQ